MSDETKSVDWAAMDLLESKATKGPWAWRMCGYTGELALVAKHSGLLYIMDFVRRGMRGAICRFAERDGNKGGLLVAVHEKFPKRTSRDPDYLDMPFPDAKLIPELRNAYPAIRAEMRAKDADIERLTGLGSPAERFGALMRELHSVLPDEADPLSSEPPEPKYIVAIQGLKGATAIMRAMLKDKDERMKRLEAEATLLRIDMGNVAELRAALTETYNAAMWLASDETGREVPKWVYDAIEAAQKLAVAK